MELDCPAAVWPEAWLEGADGEGICPDGELTLELVSGLELGLALGFAAAPLVACPLTPPEVLAVAEADWPLALALTEGLADAEGLALDCSLLGGGVPEPLEGGTAPEVELLTVMLFTMDMPVAFSRAICSARSLSAWLETVPVSVIWLLSELTLMLLLASDGSF